MIFCSFVIWTREPYIPAAAALGLLILWRGRLSQHIRWAATCGILLLVLPFVVIPFGEYTNQVIVANLPAARSITGGGRGVSTILYSLFYPLFLFFHGTWSHMRFIEMGLGVFFWAGMIAWLKETRSYICMGVAAIILALSGIRTVVPGTMYFEAFHMLPWYALFITVTVLIVTSLKKKKLHDLFVGAFIVFSFWAFASPQSFIWEHVDTHGEFSSQYAKYTQYSRAIQIVTTPSETLFLDVWDDIIYWEAKRPSSYPLSIYIPVESSLPQYQEMRRMMLLESPPDAYYNCPVMQKSLPSLPELITQEYVQLLSMGEPGCLYIKKARVNELTPNQWRQLQELGFTQL